EDRVADLLGRIARGRGPRRDAVLLREDGRALGRVLRTPADIRESLEAFERDETVGPGDLAVLAAQDDLAASGVAEAEAVDSAGPQVDLGLRRPALAPS